MIKVLKCCTSVYFVSKRIKIKYAIKVNSKSRMIGMTLRVFLEVVKQ